jgi:phosphoribosylformylglycinamidine synthase
MKAWELLLSESQERMLLVAKKGREKEVTEIFARWDLPCSVIGEVTPNGILDFYMHGQLEASLPAEELVLGGGAPQYERESREPGYLQKIRSFNPATVSVPADLRQVAKELIVLPSIASKRWVFTQYDSMVGTVNSSTNEPSDSAVVLVKGTSKGIAVTTDCNSRYVYADPYKGAMIAVSEAARNIVCSGGEPLGVTNCLNFGNPYDPEVYYQFVEVIRGMGEACRKFNTPVTGGNVSFYNQNPDGPVYPTPTIGMVGLLEDVADKMTLDFKEENDLIYLVGEVTDDLGSSEYLHNLRGVEFSAAPYFDLGKEFLLQKRLSELVAAKCIRSAHDVSEGGLFTALCESGFPNELGFTVQSVEGIRKDAFLFGEGQSRVIVTVSPGNLENFRTILHDLPYVQLGAVTSGEIMIDGEFWGSVSLWKNKYDTAIESYLAGEEAGSALSQV